MIKKARPMPPSIAEMAEQARIVRVHLIRLMQMVEMRYGDENKEAMREVISYVMYHDDYLKKMFKDLYRDHYGF